MYCEVNVGERIRYFRNLRGWSQETLALQAEINPAFLGHLERGLKSPTIKTLEKIVRALDISLAELFADPQPVDNAKDAVIAQVCDQIRDLPHLRVAVGGGEGLGRDGEHGNVVEPVSDAVQILLLHPQMLGQPQDGKALVGPFRRHLQEVSVGEGSLVDVRPAAEQILLGLLEDRSVRVL